MADFDSLLDELRAIRADRQRIPSYDVAETAVLVDGIEQLISRLADLEATVRRQSALIAELGVDVAERGDLAESLLARVAELEAS
jgi:hypothetical protein